MTEQTITVSRTIHEAPRSASCDQCDTRFTGDTAVQDMGQHVRETWHTATWSAITHGTISATIEEKESADYA